MNARILSPLLVALTTLGISISSYANRPLVPLDAHLYNYQAIDTIHSESGEIRNMNYKDLQAMNAQADLPVDNPLNRLEGVTKRQAESLLEDLWMHPVVGFANHSKYDPTGGIGFCFGRALYIHLALLHMGVDNDVIRKMWAVGPMDGGNITWGYHVTTFVRAAEPDVGWWTIDNFTGEVMSIKEWMDYMLDTSLDNKLRFYFSEAAKFGPTMGKYDPLQLGIHIPEHRDVYRNYFTDIMQFFKDGKHIGRYPLFEDRLRKMTTASVQLERGVLNESPMATASRSAAPVSPLYNTDFFESLVANTQGMPLGKGMAPSCEAMF